jgi:hypothetical protein
MAEKPRSLYAMPVFRNVDPKILPDPQVVPNFQLVLSNASRYSAMKRCILRKEESTLT